MKKHSLPIRKLVTAAMLAAAYTAINLCLLPMAFGVVQVRVAEALTMLAIFGGTAIWGVTLGCAITNTIGAFLGINFVLDIFVGTAATLIAALLTYLFRRARLWGVPVLSSLFPVLLNALFIGAELTLLETGWNPGVFVFNALSVGAGEALACCVLGLMLVTVLERKHLWRRLEGSAKAS